MTRPPSSGAYTVTKMMGRIHSDFTGPFALLELKAVRRPIVTAWAGKFSKWKHRLRLARTEFPVTKRGRLAAEARFPIWPAGKKLARFLMQELLRKAPE